jgi:hypothetical protein
MKQTIKRQGKTSTCILAHAKIERFPKDLAFAGHLLLVGLYDQHSFAWREKRLWQQAASWQIKDDQGSRLLESCEAQQRNARLVAKKTLFCSFVINKV